MLMTEKIITIDGPAASGKSSVSREISKRLGWPWVSTGAFYRGLGFVALELGVDLDDADGLSELAKNQSIWHIKLDQERTQVIFKGQDVTRLIHCEDVGAVASRISQLPQVRFSLLGVQRQCYQKEMGLVAEGRDCGTVVFPNATVKIYLTADEESRAIRRAYEQGASVSEISQMQKERDTQDKNRKVAPMVKADDAIVLDTSHLTLEQVVQEAFCIIKPKLGDRDMP